jgi:hypothetical protein
MTDQHRFAYADHLDHDLYTRTRTTDRVLNAAIVSHTPTLRMRLTLNAPTSDDKMGPARPRAILLQ